MGAVLSGIHVGDHIDVTNNGVCEEVKSKNHGIFSRETNIRTFYRRREDGTVQLILKVMVPKTRPQLDGEGGRVK